LDIPAALNNSLVRRPQRSRLSLPDPREPQTPEELRDHHADTADEAAVDYRDPEVRTEGPCSTEARCADLAATTPA
jgi:hypothetical protein